MGTADRQPTEDYITTTDTRPTQLVYTVKEAADVLRIGYSTARERIRTGELRSFKDGSRRLIAGDDLLDYIRSRQEATTDGSTICD